MPDAVLLAEPQPKRATMPASPVSGVVTGAAPEAPRPVALGVRFDFLDGIRALAACYVLLDHLISEPQKSHLIFPQVPYWFQFGHYAVDVFIVLSGYCLMLPLARKRKSDLRGETGEFIRRRAMRILPPYYAALALSLAVLWYVGQMHQVTLGALISHLLLVHNFGHVPGDYRGWIWAINPPMWSVAVEWQIYFLFPFVLLPIRKRVGDLATIVIAFAAGLVPHFALPNVWNLFSTHLLHGRLALDPAWNWDWSYPWYVGLFAMGMAAAALSYQNLRSDEKRRRTIYAAASAVLFAVAVFATIQANPLYTHPYLMDGLLGAATCLGLAWAGRHCMHPEGRHPLLIRLLGLRPLVWVGMFSYSLYLVHRPVLIALQFSLKHVPLLSAHPIFRLALLGIPVSIACSYLFYLTVERPTMMMRSRKRRSAEKLESARRPLNIFVHRASECLTDYFPNGDGLICFSLLGELARRGHRVFAYTLRDEVRERPKTMEIRARGHRIPANSLADHEHAWRAAQWLREIERTQPIDLVWRMQPLGESCPTVPFTNGHPLVLGPMFHDWPKESVAPNEAGKPRFGFGIRDTFISPLAKRGWAKTLRAASLVMCTTDVLAEKTRAKTFGKVTTVPVIVDAPAELEVKHRPLMPGSLKLLFVANLYRNKNPLIFCQTIERLRTLGVNATGEILGDGPERGAMEEWCRANGVADVVRFCGRIPNAEVYQRLADADGLISTSLGEPYGRGIAEAMSVGAVPICHRSGGPSDFIQHGIAGLLVQTLDGNDYANAIFKVWNEPGAWQRMSTAAVEQSMQWKTKAVVDRVEDSLYALLAEEAAR